MGTSVSESSSLIKFQQQKQKKQKNLSRRDYPVSQVILNKPSLFQQSQKKDIVQSMITQQPMNIKSESDKNNQNFNDFNWKIPQQTNEKSISKNCIPNSLTLSNKFSEEMQKQKEQNEVKSRRLIIKEIMVRKQPQDCSIRISSLCNDPKMKQ